MRIAWLTRALTFYVVLASSGTAWGNGKAFFTPAGKNAKVDLVYFGTIKDRITRQPLDYVDVTLYAHDVTMTFPFANDRPGHYRSPDIGLEIKAVNGRVDTSQIEIVCFIEGYKVARRTVPRTSSGTIRVDFLMDKDESDPRPDIPATAAAPVASSRAPTLGLLVLLVSAVAVRTSARLRSTKR